METSTKIITKLTLAALVVSSLPSTNVQAWSLGIPARFSLKNVAALGVVLSWARLFYKEPHDMPNTFDMDKLFDGDITQLWTAYDEFGIGNRAKTKSMRVYPGDPEGSKKVDPQFVESKDIEGKLVLRLGCEARGVLGKTHAYFNSLKSTGKYFADFAKDAGALAFGCAAFVHPQLRDFLYQMTQNPVDTIKELNQCPHAAAAAAAKKAATETA